MSGSGAYDGDEQVDQPFQAAVAVVARALGVADARLQPTLDAVVSMAAAVTGFDAGLVLLTRGRLVPQAMTGAAPHLLDRAQQQLGDGPCIEAARSQSTVQLGDTLTEGRWSEFCATAAGLGVRSMLCVPLAVDDRLVGTLSLFADRPAAFVDRDERLTALFATLAALALADAQRAQQLRTALESRDLIGQAKGILMERNRITAAEAFDRLSEQSQLRNVKLTVVAGHLVETGELLGARSARSAVQRAAE